MHNIFGSFQLLSAHSFSAPHHCLLGIPRGNTHWASSYNATAIANRPKEQIPTRNQNQDGISAAMIFVTNLSVNSFNVLKFVLLNLLLTPLLEIGLRRAISKKAKLDVVRGHSIRPRETELGIFGLHSSYYGHPAWRNVLLLAATIFIATELCFEFGSGATQVATLGMVKARKLERKGWGGRRHPKLAYSYEAAGVAHCMTACKLRVIRGPDIPYPYRFKCTDRVMYKQYYSVLWTGEFYCGPKQASVNVDLTLYNGRSIGRGDTKMEAFGDGADSYRKQSGIVLKETRRIASFRGRRKSRDRVFASEDFLTVCVEVSRMRRSLCAVQTLNIAHANRTTRAWDEVAFYTVNQTERALRKRTTRKRFVTEGIMARLHYERGEDNLSRPINVVSLFTIMTESSFILQKAWLIRVELAAVNTFTKVLIGTVVYERNAHVKKTEPVVVKLGERTVATCNLMFIVPIVVWLVAIVAIVCTDVGLGTYFALHAHGFKFDIGMNGVMDLLARGYTSDDGRGAAGVRKEQLRIGISQEEDWQQLGFTLKGQETVPRNTKFELRL